MSRIGKLPVPLTEKVDFSIGADNMITVKGDKGTSTLKIHPNISVEKNENEVIVKRASDIKEDRALHGLYRALINNMVVGVTEGYTKKLEIYGVGFRAAMSGDLLELNLGYSHPIFFVPPEGISIEVDTKTSKQPILVISGIDKELVGQVAAKIRSFRKPEPYKGKGIRYYGEQIRRKAGKSAAK
ncbi:MAG: 50S ribosomal protein L6 [Balneola sp.]|jgi:large subunit ribosomal protein L6|uniref:50S ribosomal protein L6 n=1 Tax=Balneola sp. EhC07 TaxID=1849360 RepID=UPI0007F3FC09|nr:50S ribosomal protein L6 [Balneola sp. EhC07]MBO6571660.1 50S ribosomal protein L6 [Balneola sp.]MBR9918948.1 50S ribosomal protein L6 [bacterium]OAN63344.1 50S ribosomal protein L6 [Balneola sp. EhC07]|tara:strand:- start:7095 stop:7649 length:555 start_codon:yes stop_codon:yes gene_type:complete